LAGCKPSKNHPLLVVAGKAGNDQQKDILGRQSLPKPLIA
jgi:hypothetical protein